MLQIHEQLTNAIAKYRSGADAASRQAKTAHGKARFGCIVLAETLVSIADELQRLLPERDLEGQAAIRRIFRGWDEASCRRRHQMSKLRINRLKFNRGGSEAA